MRSINRLDCWGAELPAFQPAYGLTYVQEGLCGSPWMTAVASMMLCRTQRRQAEPALKNLFARWPSASALSMADPHALASVVHPCGFGQRRSVALLEFAREYQKDTWAVLFSLPGVGPYIHDAVGLFCFGWTDLDSDDLVLRRAAAHVAQYGPFRAHLVTTMPASRRLVGQDEEA